MEFRQFVMLALMSTFTINSFSQVATALITEGMEVNADFNQVTSSECFKNYLKAIESKNEVEQATVEGITAFTVFPLPLLLIGGLPVLAAGAVTIGTVTLINRPSEKRAIKLISDTNKQYDKMVREIQKEKGDDIKSEDVMAVVRNGFISGDFCKSLEHDNGNMKFKEIKDYILINL